MYALESKFAILEINFESMGIDSIILLQSILELSKQ